LFVRVGQPIEVPVEERPQRCPGVVADKGVGQQRAFVGVALCRYRLDNGVFAVEVTVNCAGAEAGFGHDLISSGGVQAVAVEAGHGSVEDLAPAAVPVLVCHLRHQAVRATATW
jgi:hypothetical protein